mgnify:CR=1 FL=1
MLRDHLPPIDTYLADAMSLSEDDFLERYRWPWLIVPEPSPDILSEIRRPETVIRRADTQTSELDDSPPGHQGASLDALCLELRPLSGTGPVVLGRAPECDVVLLDDSISRRHAEIHGEDGGARLADLGARNGTWVEGIRLEPRAVVAVRNAAAVRLGALPGRFYEAAGFLDWLRVGAPRSGAAPGRWPGREDD